MASAVGNRKERGVGAWLPQILVRFAGCVEGELILFPKITRCHRRELLLQVRETGMFLPALLTEVIEKPCRDELDAFY
jgi:hypothetical protein